MRRAPAVAVDCDTGALWRPLQCALYGLAAAHLAAWGAALAEWPALPRTVALLLAPAAAAALAWCALRAAPVRLTWDGERWALGPGTEPGQVELMLDLGAWLLLRYRFDAPAAKPRWLALSAGAAGGDMHLLRAAVICAPPRQSH